MSSLPNELNNSARSLKYFAGLNNMQLRLNLIKYPDSTFFYSDDEWIFEYKRNNKQLLVSSLYWTSFQPEQFEDDLEISSFIKDVFKVFLNLDVLPVHRPYRNPQL